MKRFLRGSCLGLLLFVMLAGIAALSTFAIVFQQSQAVSSNAAGTAAAQVTPTRRNMASTVLPVAVTLMPPDDSITVQIDAPTSTPQPAQIVATDAPSSTSMFMPTLFSTLSPLMTASDLPRYSGTSSYPLTVTAEVMLAQTHVANYQNGVAATRTAIATESVGIYATLTAAPTSPPSVP